MNSTFTSINDAHLQCLISIRDAFFNEKNIQTTLEKLLAFRDFTEVHSLTDLMIMCVKQNINPIYTELGVALLQDCPLQILQYSSLNPVQLTSLLEHVKFLHSQHLCSSCTEMGGGHRLSALKHDMPKIFLNPGVVLYACRKIIAENLDTNICERTVSNVILQRILCSVNIRAECIDDAETLMLQDQAANPKKRKFKEE
jgi:hypothetical protein